MCPGGPGEPRSGWAALPGLRRVEDEVDRIVAAWSRERPDLDVVPLVVLRWVTRWRLGWPRANERQIFTNWSLKLAEPPPQGLGKVDLAVM